MKSRAPFCFAACLAAATAVAACAGPAGSPPAFVGPNSGAAALAPVPSQRLPGGGVFRVWEANHDGLGPAQIRFQLGPPHSRFPNYVVVFPGPFPRGAKTLFKRPYYRATVSLGKYASGPGGISVKGTAALGHDLGVLRFEGTLGKTLDLTYADGKGGSTIRAYYVGPSHAIPTARAIVPATAGAFIGSWIANLTTQAQASPFPYSIDITSSMDGCRGCITFFVMYGTCGPTESTAPTQEFYGEWYQGDWHASCGPAQTLGDPYPGLEMKVGTTSWNPPNPDATDGSWAIGVWSVNPMATPNVLAENAGIQISSASSSER